jgi:hypothetical protein
MSIVCQSRNELLLRRSDLILKLSTQMKLTVYKVTFAILSVQQTNLPFLFRIYGILISINQVKCRQAQNLVTITFM